MKIEIYSGSYCPYCVQAKKILAAHGLAFQEYDVSENVDLRDEMMSRSNGRQTIPQIFIDGQHIGGCDDLIAFEKAGHLPWSE